MSHGDMYKSDAPVWLQIIGCPPILMIVGVILIGCMAINDARQRSAKLAECEAEHKVKCDIAREVALPAKQ